MKTFMLVIFGFFLAFLGSAALFSGAYEEAVQFSVLGMLCFYEAQR